MCIHKKGEGGVLQARDLRRDIPEALEQAGYDPHHVYLEDFDGDHRVDQAAVGTQQAQEKGEASLQGVAGLRRLPRRH